MGLHGPACSQEVQPSVPRFALCGLSGPEKGELKGLGRSPVAEHLLGVCRALGSVPGPIEGKKEGGNDHQHCHCLPTL